MHRGHFPRCENQIKILFAKVEHLAELDTLAALGNLLDQLWEFSAESVFRQIDHAGSIRDRNPTLAGQPLRLTRRDLDLCKRLLAAGHRSSPPLIKRCSDAPACKGRLGRTTHNSRGSRCESRASYADSRASDSCVPCVESCVPCVESCVRLVRASSRADCSGGG